MTIQQACNRAEEVAAEHNPEGLAPFPFEKITEAYEDLRILAPAEEMPDNISGAILLIDDIYHIMVNKNKPKKRQYFTIAHELGHYFLHKDELGTNGGIVDIEKFTALEGSNILYRNDSQVSYERRETEANNFAASLIMPEGWVYKAWKSTEDIEECAAIFRVSTVAMSIRLERLGLVR